MLLGIVLAVLTIVTSNTAWAVPEPPPETYFYDLIVDSDNDPDTGCETHVQDDNIDLNLTGIERIVRAKVGFMCPGPTAEVQHLERLDCDPDTGIFDHDVYDNGDWPVGNNTGIGGADVIEAFAGLDDLNLTSAAAKIAFRATGPQPNSDVLLTVDGTDPESAAILLLRYASTPAASPMWLAVATILLITFGTWILRRRVPSTAGIAMLVFAVVASGALTAWAGFISLDGEVGDWAGIEPVGIDALNDSSKNDDGEDIVAGFAVIAQPNLYFRFDVKNLATLDDCDD